MIRVDIYPNDPREMKVVHEQPDKTYELLGYYETIYGNDIENMMRYDIPPIAKLHRIVPKRLDWKLLAEEVDGDSITVKLLGQEKQVTFNVNDIVLDDISFIVDVDGIRLIWDEGENSWKRR